MRRLAVFLGALLCVLMLSGCATAAESRLDEYRATGEDLAMHVVGLIPERFEPLLYGSVDSEGQAPQNGVMPDPRPQDVAWWQVRAYVTLAARENASAEAIVAVTAALEEEKWRVSRVRETEGGGRVTDAFRKNGWYIEIAWSRSEPGKAERFDVLVVSPDTVRGEHDEIRS